MNLSRHHYASPTKGLLIDANLLTLMIVGMLGNGEIARFKRTSSHFIEEDALGMDQMIRQFGWVATTPHIMTETSNLLGGLDKFRLARARDYLASFAQRASEIEVSSTHVVESPAFYNLGLTDAALCLAAKQEPLALVTIDGELYQYAASRLSVEAINFNHIRQEWLFD